LGFVYLAISIILLIFLLEKLFVEFVFSLWVIVAGSDPGTFEDRHIE